MSREVCFLFEEVNGGTLAEQMDFLTEVASVLSVAEQPYVFPTPNYCKTFLHYSSTVQTYESMFYTEVENVLNNGNHPNITSVKTKIVCRDEVIHTPTPPA
jgi:hypothetical protein